MNGSDRSSGSGAGVRFSGLFLVLLLLASLAMALPAPPSTPDPSSIPSGSLVVSAPATTASPFDVSVSQSTGLSYPECAILKGVAILKDFSLDSGVSKTLTLTLPAGKNELVAACALDTVGTGIISKQFNVTVQTSDVLSFLEPDDGDVLTDSDVVVKYRYAGTTARACTLSLDSEDWTRNDARWKLDALTRTLQPGATRSETFSGLDDGEHRASLNCSGLPRKNVSFSVSTETDLDVAITITSPAATATSPVVVSFKHNGTSSATCTVRVDGALAGQSSVAPAAIKSFTIQLPLGERTIRVTCLAPTWAASAARAVQVSSNGTTGTTTYTPSLLLTGMSQGGVDEGTTLLFSGSGFPPGGIVDVTIAGAGVSDSAIADSSGGFVFTQESLDPGTYTIRASSGSAKASLQFIVRSLGGSFTPPPDEDLPNVPIDPTPEQPSVVSVPSIDNKGSSWWIWLLIFLAIPLLLVCGGIGYLAYTGELDWNDLPAQLTGLAERLVGRGEQISHARMPPISVPARDLAQLRGFIDAERAKGFDDLAIRNSLLEHGWDEIEVDSVFDELYRTTSHG